MTSVTSSPVAADRREVDVHGPGVRRQFAFQVVEHCMLENDHRIRILQRGPQHAARVRESSRRDDAQPRDVGVPAFQAMRMLGSQLAPAPVAIRITSGTLICPPDM